MEIVSSRLSATPAPASLEVRGLTKMYDEFPAVRDLSFNVCAGQIVGLVGPNGAGKTTTMRCLCGIIPPTEGGVKIAGWDLAKNPLEVKRRLAFLPDEPRLFNYLTVTQHLTFTARIFGVANYREKALALLEELGIADKKNMLPAELSRGIRQKVVIACGLLHSPEIMFLDEPMTGLDPLGLRQMRDAILRRSREGMAILISSHLLHLMDEICSHVIILKHGRKIFDGTVEAVRERFASHPGDVSLEEVFFKATLEEGE